MGWIAAKLISTNPTLVSTPCLCECMTLKKPRAKPTYIARRRKTGFDGRSGVPCMEHSGGSGVPCMAGKHPHVNSRKSGDSGV